MSTSTSDTITFQSTSAATNSDASLNFSTFTDTSGNNFSYVCTYNFISYTVELYVNPSISGDTYTTPINSEIMNSTNKSSITSTYTYTSSSITLSSLTIMGVTYSDISLVVNDNTYTFTQDSDTSTITYDNETGSLTYSGTINQFALLMFGYVAILTGIYDKTTDVLCPPGSMCQTVALNMLGF